MTSLLLLTIRAQLLEAVQSVLTADEHLDQVVKPDHLLREFQKKRHEVVLIDLDSIAVSGGRWAADKGRSLMGELKRLLPTVQIVLLTPRDRVTDAIAAVKAGASSYHKIPIKPEELRHIIDRSRAALRALGELEHLRANFGRGDAPDLARSNSEAMQGIYEQLRAVAPTRATILLLGETGTGKSLLAKLIHRLSNRAEKPLISVHCGAIPEGLVESELFGHEKGAFTGAIRKKLGKFEIAHGGSIFLDEIGTISAAVQIKLLQVLQEQTFQRVGGESTLVADVRVLAATNVDIEAMVQRGEFRSDLFYRLNVFAIRVPPLRERSEDIPLLADLFLNQLNRRYSKDIAGLRPGVLEALCRYQWPGNIRELENVMERAYILEQAEMIGADKFPPEIVRAAGAQVRVPWKPDPAQSLAEVRRMAVAQAERGYLEEVLKLHGGRVNQSALAAGITTRQLHKLMKRYDLRKEGFRQPHP